MTKSKKPSKDSDNLSKSDKQTYRTVGVVFLIAGVIFMVSESTRATGLPFLVLGFTFYILSQQESTPKK